MKKLLLFSVAMLLGIAANAQGLQRAPRLTLGAPTTKATIEAGEGQLWWGTDYEGKDLVTYGTRTAETFDLASFFSSSKYGLTGSQVSAIRFYMPDVNRDEIGDSIIVWIATSRPSNVRKANVTHKVVSVDDLTLNAFNDVDLDTVYTLKSSGLYAGYTYTITSAEREASQYTMVSVDNSSNSDGAWVRCSETQGLTSWLNFYSYYGVAFPIHLLFSGDFKPNVQIANIENSKALKGHESSFGVTVKNMSPLGFKTLGYTLTDDEGNTTEHTYSLPQSYSGFDALTFNVELKGSDLKSGTYNLRLATVDGVDNAAAEKNKAGSSFLTIFSRTATTKRVVEEEFTGTWCGWCPRGMVGMELAEKAFGDKFIGIAVHKGSTTADPMESTGAGYADIISSYITGFPSCLLDRTSGAIDPYYGTGSDIFSLKDDFEAHLAKATEADIELTAEWKTADRKAILTTTNTTFYLDAEKASYALGFVVVSDSLTGTGATWAQANYFASYASSFADEPNLSGLTKMGSRIANMYFNHVAILGKGVKAGLTNSIKSPIVDGETQSYSYSLTLPTSTNLVQNKDNIRVIAMIIDTNTGDIVNAAEAHIAPPTGINDVKVNSASEVVGRYNLKGQRVSALERGVIIVKYADGHSEKVIIK